MRGREGPAEVAEAVVLTWAAAAEPHIPWVAAAEPRIRWVVAAEPRIRWVVEVECISAEVAEAHRILAERPTSPVAGLLTSAVARISAVCPVAGRRGSAARMPVVHLILPAGRRHRTLRRIPLSTAGVRLRPKVVLLSMASVPSRSGALRAGLPTGRRRYGIAALPTGRRR
jgi:hypothetical protein